MGLGASPCRELGAQHYVQLSTSAPVTGLPHARATSARSSLCRAWLLPILKAKSTHPLVWGLSQPPWAARPGWHLLTHPPACLGAPAQLGGRPDP